MLNHICTLFYTFNHHKLMCVVLHSTPNHGDTSIHGVKIQIGMKTINFKLVLNEIQKMWFQEIIICSAPATHICVIIVTHCEQLGWVPQLWILEKGRFGKFWTKISMFFIFIYFNFSIYACCLHVTMLIFFSSMMVNPILVLWSPSTRFAHVFGG